MTRNPNWHRELIAQGGKVTNRTGSHFVADCGKGDEAEAFARLFAAAPEMLFVLKMILAHTRTGDTSVVYMPNEVERARAVIARATGAKCHTN